MYTLGAHINSARLKGMVAQAFMQGGLELAVFARQAIIAHLAGAESLGDFLLLILVQRAGSMAVDLHTNRWVMAEKHIDAIDIAHSYQLISAIGLSILLFLGHAHLPVSHDALIVLLAAITLKALQHQDYRRQLCNGKHMPLFLVEIAPTFISIGLAIAFIFADIALHWIILWQAILEVTASHFAARTEYRLCLKRNLVLSALRFGLPLWISGLLMFFSLYGERTILASTIDAASFAALAVAIQLSLMPVQILGRIAILELLPRYTMLSATEQQATYKQQMRFALVACPFYALAFVWIAPLALNIVFGLSVPNSTIALLAFAQAVRMARIPASIYAQAIHATHIPLYANCVRVAGFLISAAITLMHNTINPLFWGGFVAELAAFSLQSFLLHSKSKTQKTLSLQIEGAKS